MNGLTLSMQLLQGSFGQTATDLQSLRHNWGGDEFVAGHLLVQFIVGRLVEEYQVVKLIPDLSLGPLLQYSNWWVSRRHEV